MKISWPNIAINEFAEERENAIDVLPSQSYKLLGLSLAGRGLFVREQKEGIEMGAKTINKVVPGDFIYSRLFAWKGAFDYVKPEFDGTYVSNEFPSFQIDETKADIKFLTYYFKQSKIWHEVEQYCIGVTKASRNRFKEKFFLGLKIPLPPLAEQKRIVVKLDAVRQQSVEIQKLRKEQERDIKNLLYSRYVEIIEGAEWKPMGDIAPITRRPVEVAPEGEYPEMGIRSFGNGTFHKPSLSGIDVGTKKLFYIKAGDLMFSNVFAWEGAIAVAQKEDDNRVGSHRFISCVCDTLQVIPEYLCFHLLTEQGMEDIRLASPGGAGRNKTLGLTKLEKIEVPVPDMTLQQEFAELQASVKKLQTEQTASGEELLSLFPALLNKAFEGEL